MAKMKWTDLSSVADMDTLQWRTFNKTLVDAIDGTPGLDDLVTTITKTDSKPPKKKIRKQLLDLARLKNRPRADLHRCVDKRLPPLLQALGIPENGRVDFEDDAAVYMSNDVPLDAGVGYVGRGTATRSGRYSGQSLPRLRPNGGDEHLPCLEFSAMWICRTGLNPLNENKNTPTICTACKNESMLPVLASILRRCPLGNKWTMSEILEILKSIATIQFIEE